MKSTVRVVCQAASVALASMMAAACGGGGGNGEDASDPASAKTLEQEREGIPYEGAVTVRGGDAGAAKALMAAEAVAAIPADAHLKGMWSPVIDWPLIAIHAVLLPDGRVLSYGSSSDGTQTGYLSYDLWTPTAGFGPEAHLTLANQSQVDLFCNAQLVLPQPGAGVVLVGGDIFDGTRATNTANYNSAVFNTTSNQVTKTNDLNRARWYATATTLLNGETYIQGGAGGTDRPEIRGTNGAYRLLSSADTSAFDYWYPRNFLAPDGRIFGFDSYGKMFYVNTSGNGSVTNAGQFTSGAAGNTSSAAMFRPGRILQFNGNSNAAIVIDITGSSPQVTPTASMSSRRMMLSGTLLPNGHVLATGGSGQYNELVDVNNSAEMWNPSTGTWTLGSSGALARLYHSNALLLPDATVLVAGGGAPGPLNNLNAEIYSPPYLFTSGGVAATRPRITAAPTQLVVGNSFNLDFADAPGISRVVLIKTGSATHGWNMEQRFIELAFTASGQRLTVQMSSRAADTPPGYYMIFVLNAEGVPSVAKIAWINVAGTPNPNTTPVITNPGNRTGTTGTAISPLQVQASDADGNPLTFSASGLPTGLSISASGLIMGTPSTAGSFNSVVSVSDGTASASANFTWTITQGGGGPLVLDPVPTPAPAQAGTDVTFTASATGTGVQFQWNFGDGTAATVFSSSKTTTHRYNSAGLFFVTLTARDGGGAQQTQTALQIVHLPLTARGPTQSSSVAYDRNNGGTPRIWVVNPDNDTVSIFNANTGAKISEVTVGTSPRSVAFDAAGHAWVTSKRSANVSVIDRSSLSVTRTIAMPRV
ncbi:MAG: galactose oxidase-like domain-containing protein, partial [Panacagrimonas sp.]